MLMSRTLFKCILNFSIAVDLYGSTLRQHIIKVPDNKDLLTTNYLVFQSFDFERT
jgi:hypothetical protein